LLHCIIYLLVSSPTCFGQTWVETNAEHIIEYGLLSQAETCRRPNQKINNRVRQVGIDSLWPST